MSNYEVCNSSWKLKRGDVKFSTGNLYLAAATIQAPEQVHKYKAGMADPILVVPKLKSANLVPKFVFFVLLGAGPPHV